MRKTEHYGLNQWDLSDQIKMEDFNQDNAKLEAALTALTKDGPPLALIRFLPYHSEQIGIGISMETWGVDWTKWSIVFIVQLAERANNLPSDNMRIRLGDDYENSVSFPVGDSITVLFPMWDPENKARAMVLSNEGAKFVVSKLTYQELKVITVEGLNSKSVRTMGTLLYGIQ